MAAYDYESAFADDIRGFLAFKEDMGIASNSRSWHLRDFDRWCVASGSTEFDRGTVEGWVLWRKSKTSPRHQTWMSHIRELGRWMRMNGSPDAYVLSEDFRSKMTRVAPHLLDSAEIAAFFDAAASYSPPSPMAWEARCLFGLMHSCGLRTCEAVRLRREDVDLGGMRMDIMWSKGHRSRRLPVTDEVADMLARCDAATTSAVGASRTAFFTTSTGHPLTSGEVGQAFRRIWDAAGLPESKGGKRPRPYDFRHHFAYANIERWGREGRDVMAMLPYLARYMGHATFDSTYYYVNTSPDFMARFPGEVASIDSLLPEVGFDG